MSRARTAARWLCAAALATGCAAPPDERALVQVGEGRPAMGTVLEITVVAGSEPQARAAIQRCFDEAERLESIFTTWREDGELARLNAGAGRGPQPVSPELLRILRDAQELARATAGTFDVSVGPLVALWREAERRQARPTPAELRAARRAVGPDRARIDASRRTVALQPGASLDLGGFAKGWTLDRLGELLAREAIARAFLSFGGSSLLALGTPLDAPTWRAAVEDDFVLALRDRSVSISSSFGQRLEIDGVAYAHIVDPRSGLPVERRQRAVVVAGDGATAEAWSKALVVLAPAQGLDALAPHAGIDARVDAGELRLQSAGFARHVAHAARP